VTAGINNVSKRKGEPAVLEHIIEIYSKLLEDNYDKRIPLLVAHYFQDMNQVFNNVASVLTDSGDFFIDIGDSKFKNVHVPTDKIFEKIAFDNNLELIDKSKLRERYSKDGTPLGQWLLHFKKKRNYTRKSSDYKNRNKTNKTSQTFDTARGLVKANWEHFRDNLPYLFPPYNKRNWGNSLHSLCSYQGKLKPAIAHFLVKYFSQKEMFVLDPLSGVGTIPFEAALQGRKAIGNDLSYIANAITLGKIGKAQKSECAQIISKLESFIEKNIPEEDELNEIEVDYNKHIKEYYHPGTFKQIIAARNFFKKNKVNNGSEAIVFSSLLHILHGNRPYALSRRSHPITPFAPKGEFVKNDLIEKLKEKVNRSLKAKKTTEFSPGLSIWGDFKKLDDSIEHGTIDTIITSPPFFDSTKFYLANWIRLWFAGWDKEDFDIKKKEFIDTIQINDLDIYDQFFKMCKTLLKPTGAIVMHLGFSKKANMAELLIPYAEKYFEVEGYFNENVVNTEKFGISDLGGVKNHQYLFITNR